MSRWYEAKKEDIVLDEDGKTLDIYIFTDDSGNVYLEIPLEVLRPYFSDKKLPIDISQKPGVR
jgi:hypothetical protein